MTLDSIGLFCKQLGRIRIRKVAHIQEMEPERRAKTDTHLCQQLQINPELCCWEFICQVYLCLANIVHSSNFEVNSPRQVLGNLPFVKAPQSPQQSIHHCWNPFKDKQKGSETHRLEDSDGSETACTISVDNASKTLVRNSFFLAPGHPRKSDFFSFLVIWFYIYIATIVQTLR